MTKPINYNLSMKNFLRWILIVALCFRLGKMLGRALGTTLIALVAMMRRAGQLKK